MNRIERFALAIALAAASVAAHAAPGINACATADGPLYGDDAARNACKDSPIHKLNPGGSPRELVPAPLTPEQRKAKDEKDRKLADCNRRNREQRQKDEALIDKFPSEDDLQDARYRELGQQLRRVDEANGQMKRILERDRKLAQQAAFHPRQIPEPLQRDQEANRQQLRSEIDTIEDVAHAIQEINDRYDTKLKRYRELVNRTAAMPCSGQE